VKTRSHLLPLAEAKAMQHELINLGRRFIKVDTDSDPADKTSRNRIEIEVARYSEGATTSAEMILENDFTLRSHRLSLDEAKAMQLELADLGDDFVAIDTDSDLKESAKPAKAKK
jgi:hypothetical protein